MTYRPDPTNPETWLTLKQVRDQIPEGKWGFSRVYEDVNVAIAIGHAHDFWELPDYIQAYAIARFRARGSVEAFEDELHKKDMKSRNANRQGRHGHGMRR